MCVERMSWNHLRHWKVDPPEKRLIKWTWEVIKSTEQSQLSISLNITVYTVHYLLKLNTPWGLSQYKEWHRQSLLHWLHVASCTAPGGHLSHRSGQLCPWVGHDIVDIGVPSCAFAGPFSLLRHTVERTAAEAGIACTPAQQSLCKSTATHSGAIKSRE